MTESERCGLSLGHKMKGHVLNRMAMPFGVVTERQLGSFSYQVIYGDKKQIVSAHFPGFKVPPKSDPRLKNAIANGFSEILFDDADLKLLFVVQGTHCDLIIKTKDETQNFNEFLIQMLQTISE